MVFKIKMIITDNLGSLLTQSLFGWLKDKQMLTYLLVATIITIITSIVSLLSVSDFFNYLIKLAPTLIENNGLSVLDFIGLMGTLTPAMMISTIEGIILFVLSYFIIKRGLELNGKKGVDFSITRIIILIVLEIITFFVAALSPYRLKWLGIGIIGFIFIILGGLLSIISPASMILAFIGMILIIAYFIIVIINYIRLSLGIVAYIEKDIEIMEALKTSWDLTKGNELGLIIISISVSLIIGVFSYIASIPSTMFLQMVILGLGNVDSTIGFELVINTILGTFSNPIYLILLIPVFIISAYQIVTLSYLLPLVYTTLKKEVKRTKKQETYHF